MGGNLARQLQTKGIERSQGVIGQTKTDAKARQAARVEQVDTGLSYEFPSGMVGEFGFTSIDVDAGLAFASPGAAWFGLNSWNVPEDTNAQEVYWTGYNVFMAPCDCTGAGLDTARFPAPAGGYVPWGDQTAVTANTRNTHAYLVIGVNLPCRVGTWQAGPTLFPGVANTADGKRIARAELVQRQAIRFPPGNFIATGTIASVRQIENKLPQAIRLVNGMRLDVALVVGVHVVNGKASVSAIAGHVVGNVSFGMRFSETNFQPS